MTIRDKLLTAVQVDVELMSDDTLVDLILEQLKRAKADLVEARNALIKEGMRADDITRQAREDIQRMRSDPTWSTQGSFFFLDPSLNGGTGYVVTVANRYIYLTLKSGPFDYAVQQINAGEYAKWLSSK